MKVVLELQDQPSNVRRITVRHDIVIGRGSDCNLRLSAPQVSRRHCFLRVGREGVSVTDLDSSNGTYINGKRIKPGKREDLANGAVLGLGPIRFIIHVREEAVSSDVLGSSPLHEVIDQSGKARASSSSSTLMSKDQLRPVDFQVESGGPSRDSDESTAFLSDPTRGRSTSHPLPEYLDSRAEIVDLGKRLGNSDSSHSASPRDPMADAPTSAADELEHLDVLDVVEVVDDHDEVDADSAESTVTARSPLAEAQSEFSSRMDAEAPEDQSWFSGTDDEEVIEDVEVVADDIIIVGDDEDVSSNAAPPVVPKANHFEMEDEILEVEDVVEVIDDDDIQFAEEDPQEKPATAKGDDIDPDLQKFLKGFSP